MGRDYTVRHAAALCRQLPRDSRVADFVRSDEQREAELWDFGARLSAAQLNCLRTLVWLNSQDGYEGKNRPEPLLPPEDRGGAMAEVDAGEYLGLLESMRERIRRSRTEREGGADAG